MRRSTKLIGEWAINKIKTEYKDDIALLVGVADNSVNDDGHGECFDYFVPSTERGFELSKTFIVEGIGHDLYPRSWKRTEDTANFIDNCTKTLADAKILYYRSEEDLNKFLALKQQLFDNLKDYNVMYKVALKKLDESMNLYKKVMFEDKLYRVRVAVAYVFEYLCDALLFLDGKYNRDNIVDEIKELSFSDKNKYIIEKFVNYNDRVLTVNTVDDGKSLVHDMIVDVREFMSDNKPIINDDGKVDYAELADWYQELSLSWTRIDYYTSVNDVAGVFHYATYLQNEFLLIKDEFNLSEDYCDLLGYFDKDNLDSLNKRAKEIENYIVKLIDDNGVKICKYDTVDDFLQDN